MSLKKYLVIIPLSFGLALTGCSDDIDVPDGEPLNDAEKDEDRPNEKLHDENDKKND
ncbi:hypothetical protein [Bacillus marinisedimentorum]|uniref:hypothetical protein n=1 Tax=Bacillus marinisedimentorum TaxID=1821260 RepID=UPI0012FFCE4C|nr:hypothetical protein [Bacillus marinisedimentorum]